MPKDIKFVVRGTEHSVFFRGNNVVLDGEKIKLKTLEKESQKGITVFKLPVEGEEIQLVSRSGLGISAVRDGIDLATGKEYNYAPTPKWTYIFAVLYFAEFFTLIGGALGAAIDMTGYLMTVKIALNQEKTTGKRVLNSVLLFLGITVVNIILLFAIVAARR